MPRHPDSMSSHRRLLAVTIVRGTRVVPRSTTIGHVIGFSPSHCVYRLDDPELTAVAPWSDLAIADVIPAPTLFPNDVAELDRLDLAASALRELLELSRGAQPTPAQLQTVQELLADLARSAR